MAPEPRSNCGLFATEKDGKKILYVFGGLNAEQGWMSSIWKGEIDVQSGARICASCPNKISL